MARVLFIRGGAIGDFILTLPALRLVRDTVPDPEVEVLGYRPITALAEAAGLAVATRSMEHAALSVFFVPGAKLDPGWAAYFRSFDLVVSYLFDPDKIFETNLTRAGAETVVACSHRVDPTSGVPAPAQLAKPLESLAMFLDDPAPQISLAPQEAPGLAAPVVAVHPGSGSPLKNWGYENWAAALELVSAAVPGVSFLVVSGEAESETVPDFLKMLGSAGLRFYHADSLPLPELGSLLAGTSAFAGHDSGITHLAAAVGRPVVALFGPTEPAVWAPQNAGVTVLQAPEGRLDRITPPSVASAIVAKLPAAGSGGVPI